MEHVAHERLDDRLHDQWFDQLEHAHRKLLVLPDAVLTPAQMLRERRQLRKRRLECHVVLRLLLPLLYLLQMRLHFLLFAEAEKVQTGRARGTYRRRDAPVPNVADVARRVRGRGRGRGRDRILGEQPSDQGVGLELHLKGLPRLLGGRGTRRWCRRRRQLASRAARVLSGARRGSAEQAAHNPRFRDAALARLRGLLGRVIRVEDGERLLNEKAEAQHVGPEGERRVAKGGAVLGDGQCAAEQLEHLDESAALELGGLSRVRLEEGDCAQHLSPSLVPGVPDGRHHVL